MITCFIKDVIWCYVLKFCWLFFGSPDFSPYKNIYLENAIKGGVNKQQILVNKQHCYTGHGIGNGEEK